MRKWIDCAYNHRQRNWTNPSTNTTYVVPSRSINTDPHVITGGISYYLDDTNQTNTLSIPITKKSCILM